MGQHLVRKPIDNDDGRHFESGPTRTSRRYGHLPQRHVGYSIRHFRGGLSRRTPAWYGMLVGWFRDRRLPGQSDVLLGCSVLEHWCDLRGSRGGSRFAGDRGGGWSTGCCRPADGLWVLHLRRPLAGAGRRNVVDDSLVETDDETRVRRLSGRVGGLSCWVRLRTGRVGRSSIGGDGGGVGRVLW